MNLLLQVCVQCPLSCELCCPLCADGGKDPGNEEMERMLSELTHIVPPSSLPVTDSLTSDRSDTTESDMGAGECDVGGSDGENSLSVLRRRLDEAVLMAETEESETVSVSVQPPTPTVATGPIAVTGKTVQSSKLHSGTSTPKFSPGSSRGSPEPSSKVHCSLYE